MVPGWLGRPLRPAWPAATEPDWSPPRVKGIPHYDLPVVDVLAVGCPRCNVAAGEPCRWPSGGHGRHRPRLAAATTAGHVQQMELASWVPIVAGLTPHGFRHSQRVWLDDVGIPSVLVHDRLGHSMPGIGGTYAHVSVVHAGATPWAASVAVGTDTGPATRAVANALGAGLERSTVHRVNWNRWRPSPEHLPIGATTAEFPPLAVGYRLGPVTGGSLILAGQIATVGRIP
ncbi:zinc finger domain-containing protein [Actinomadura rubrisoli]|uniref:zinc finger domain-containing protein n=1 Tax=Actinomadura rubrisoli TaxID=2530368 RepID=UPI003C7E6ACF